MHSSFSHIQGLVLYLQEGNVCLGIEPWQKMTDDPLRVKKTTASEGHPCMECGVQGGLLAQPAKPAQCQLAHPQVRILKLGFMQKTSSSMLSLHLLSPHSGSSEVFSQARLLLNCLVFLQDSAISSNAKEI